MSLLDYFGGLFGRLPKNYSPATLGTMQQLNSQILQYQQQKAIEMLTREVRTYPKRHDGAIDIEATEVVEPKGLLTP